MRASIHLVSRMAKRTSADPIVGTIAHDLWQRHVLEVRYARVQHDGVTVHIYLGDVTFLEAALTASSQPESFQEGCADLLPTPGIGDLR